MKMPNLIASLVRQASRKDALAFTAGMSIPARCGSWEAYYRLQPKKYSLGNLVLHDVSPIERAKFPELIGKSIVVHDLKADKMMLVRIGDKI
jgi:hypothetical protein